MRVGIDARYATSVGGPSTYTRNLIKNLLKVDYKNEYYLYVSNNYEANYLNLQIRIPENAKIRVVRKAHNNVGPIMCGRNLYLKPSGMIKLKFFIRISLHYLCWDHLIILTIYDIDIEVCPEDFSIRENDFQFNKSIFYTFCRFADKIIIPSISTKEDLIRKYHINDEKVAIISLSAKKHFKPLDKELSKSKIARKYGHYATNPLYS